MNDKRISRVKKAPRPKRAVANKPAKSKNYPMASATITRDIGYTTKAMLWGKAAGRCEFEGCNKVLWKSPLTQETVNIAQMAHVYAFSSGGPRASKQVRKEKLNELDNLLLVCHECHRKIDQRADGGRYTVELLREWKAKHERRIHLVTGIDADKTSEVVLYGANIGGHKSPLNRLEAERALFPSRYPADDVGIQLSTINESFRDRDDRFWQRERENLENLFASEVRRPLANGNISHLSIFALAPQPLLIRLGTLLTDIPSVDVYQLHREPEQTWCWPDEGADGIALKVTRSRVAGRQPALVIALSAKVSASRVTKALGAPAAIWRVTVERPDSDLIKSKDQLSEFRRVVRRLLDDIQCVHGERTPLHIFPVGPVSTALELGRVRMPKAQQPWIVYDQVNERGGFIRALDIP